MTTELTEKDTIERIVDLMFELDGLFEEPVGFTCLEGAPKHLALVFNNRTLYDKVSEEIKKRKNLH